MHRVLAVDDEPKNLKLIEAYLEDANYEVTTATNGAEAWDTLQQDSNFDIILLDRMMPVMNGMELLQKLKNDETFKTIPVIMQTAAAERSQVLEGMRAGVFHYLTKPYDEEILLSIISSCIQDHGFQSELRSQVLNKKKMLGLIKSCEIEFNSIDEANDVATYLATLFPDPSKVVMGISELLINAVEHGNLGISYDMKTELKNANQWEDEIEKLLQSDEHKNKIVKVTYHNLGDKVQLVIKDQGAGFDWQKYLELTPERATDNHGRGIAIANAISFEKIEYQGCGNEVKCTINLKTPT